MRSSYLEEEELIVVRATHDVCQEIQHFECRCQTCCSDAKNLKKLADGELS